MDMKKMMKEAQKMQAQIEQAQAEAQLLTAEATSGGGMVTVVAGGDLDIKSIKIDPAGVDPDDVEMLEDMVLAAVNEALRNVQELVNMRISAVTGGLSLPGF